MIKNFIKDAELMVYAPNIKSQMYSGQSSYDLQISKAFDLMLNDFQKSGYDVRLMMNQVDLNNYAPSVDNPPLVAFTKTADTNFSPYLMQNRRRLVVDVSAGTFGSSYFTLKLQGSNKVAEPVAGDTSWTDIAGSSFQVKATGQYTVVCLEKYNWVRLSVVKNSATTMTATAYLVETVFDNLICLRTLMLLYSDWRKEQNDEWDFKYADMKLQYDAELANVKFYYDENEDGVSPDELGETETATLSLRR
jgi:hypothetical protein